jgi:glycosyltransferase involved in cell wall biosynthesis
MRILHFLDGRCNPDSANGVDKLVYFLTRELASMGHDVQLVQATDRAEVSIPGVRIATIPPPQSPFGLPFGLLGVLRTFQPEIVHLHSVFAPRNYMVARWVHGYAIPYALTPHGGLSPLLVNSSWMKKLYARVFERWIVGHAAFIHALGDQDCTFRFPVRPPVVVMPNAIDACALPDSPDRGFLATLAPRTAGKKVFLFLGRIAPRQKGLDLLISAFAQAGLPGSVLVIAGPGPDREVAKLRRLAFDCGVADAVEFCGPVYGERRFDLLASATVFVHTSRWEGLPFAVLEAAAMALPCILTGPADPLGLLAAHHGSVTVEPLEARVAAALGDLAARSPAELRALGERARRVVLSNFTWPKVASSMLAAYQRYAPPTKPGSCS